MNLYIISYTGYLLLTYYTTVVVGHKLYKHGIHFVRDCLKEEEQAVASNKMLLVGYYLVNLGYVAISIITWPELTTKLEAFEAILFRSGIIIFTLGVMHLINIVVLKLIARKRKQNELTINQLPYE